MNRLTLPVIACFGALAGCSHEPTVVGKWTGDMMGLPSVTAEFKEDKTLTVDGKLGAYGAKLSGKYEIDSKNLTVTFDKYTTSGVDASLKPVADSLIKPNLNTPFKLAYHFNKADELALTYHGKTDLIKRVAESGS